MAMLVLLRGQWYVTETLRVSTYLARARDRSGVAPTSYQLQHRPRGLRIACRVYKEAGGVKVAIQYTATFQSPVGRPETGPSEIESRA